SPESASVEAAERIRVPHPVNIGRVPPRGRCASFQHQERSMPSKSKTKCPGPVPAMPKRLALAASMAALCTGLCAPAFSADTEVLLDKLREKGVLTEEEYQEMRTEARAERRAQALK